MSGTTRFLDLICSRAREVRNAFVSTDFDAFGDLGSEANRRLTLVLLGAFTAAGGLVGTIGLVPYADRLNVSTGEILTTGVILCAVGVAALAMSAHPPRLALDGVIVAVVAAITMTVSINPGRVAGTAVLCYFWAAVAIAILRSAVSTVVHFAGIAAAAGLVFFLDDTFSDPLFWWGFVVLTLAVVWQSIGWLVRRARALAVRERHTRARAEEASDQLELANRRMSRFLATMSHELRTPMNAIIGFAEMLRRRVVGPLNDRQAAYVDDIVESGRHLSSLIDDTLDDAMVETGRYDLETADTPIRELVHESVTLIRERAERAGVEVVLTLGDVGHAHLDGRKIKQVLANLLSNAVKFTPRGGTITVLVRRVDGTVEFSVADTGPGIDPEHQESIFEEFHQAGTGTRGAEGTGLGLAVARRFVELHSGRIRVDSAPGDGACFTFTVPSSPSSREVRARTHVGTRADHDVRPRSGFRIVSTRTLLKRSFFFGAAVALGAGLGAVAVDAPDVSRTFLEVTALAVVGVMIVVGVAMTVLGARGLVILGLALMFAAAVAAAFGFYYLGPLAPAAVAVWMAQAFYVRLFFLKLDMRGTWGHWTLVAVAAAVVLAIQPGNEAPIAQWLTVVSTVWVGSFLVGWLIRRLQDIAAAERSAADEANRISAALEQASRYKGQFLAGMSHELRTPLNAVIGFAEALRRELAGSLTDGQREYVDTIAESGHQLLDLINDVLDLAKIDAGRFDLRLRGEELAPILAAAADAVRDQAATKQIRLELDIDTKIEVFADVARLTQAVSALLSNAVKFTPSGGTVMMRTHCRDDVADVADVVVSDTGPGIDAAEHEAVFEAFHHGSTDPARASDGPGLGLALARSVLELHGGSLSVESALGHGATFTAVLPTREPNARSAFDQDSGTLVGEQR